jgi:hypothetical protein
MYIIAMLTMLIDHAGIVFAPHQEVWRIIGRFAMPIYAYCLVVGYKHTRSKKKYIQRLAMIAALSQLPFVFAFQTVGINNVGTLLVCFLVLVFLDRYKEHPASWLILIPALVLLEVLPFDYGAYGLLLVLFYRYLDSHTLVLAHIGLNILYVFYKGWAIQMYSIFPTMLLVYWPSVYAILDRVKVKRWIWRSFYPAHLAVLAAFQLAAQWFK